MENSLKLEKTVKTRNQSALEYFESIQIEYICAELRSKIYSKAKDKEYWKKVCLGKKQKIEDFVDRNHLPSIFTDSDLNTFLNSKVYLLNRTPNFVYRDEEQKESQHHLDLIYYYSKDSDVRIHTDDEVFVGKVVSYRAFNKTILIDIDGETKEWPTEIVVRIL